MVKIEREVDVLEYTIIKMSHRVLQMHEILYSLLGNYDCEKALELIQSDTFINNIEEEVNDMAISVFALLSPVASDLRRVITAIKMASELERIADYAKNSASYMIKNEDIDPILLPYTQKMQEQFISMLKKATIAYENKDIELAFSLPKDDEVIDSLMEECYALLEEQSDKTLLKKMIRAGSLLRCIERSGDHTTNISELVIYCVKGLHYDFG